jgi:hypothetical protein
MMNLFRECLLKAIPAAMVLTLFAGTAMAGIEEHSPVPTQEEWELLMLDDEFWDGVEEARDRSSEGNPSTNPYAAEGMVQDDEFGAVGNQEVEAHGRLYKKFTTFDPDNPFDEELMDHAELKWRLATLGIEYLTEEELENWKEEAADKAVEETRTETGSQAQGNAATASSSASTASASGEGDDDSDDSETAEKEGSLSQDDEVGYESAEPGGCNTAGGTGVHLFGLLFAGLVILRRSDKVLH